MRKLMKLVARYLVVPGICLTIVSGCALDGRDAKLHNYDGATTEDRTQTQCLHEAIDELTGIQERISFPNSHVRLDSDDEQALEYDVLLGTLLLASQRQGAELRQSQHPIVLHLISMCGEGDECRALVLTRIAGAAGIPYGSVRRSMSPMIDGLGLDRELHRRCYDEGSRLSFRR